MPGYQSAFIVLVQKIGPSHMREHGEHLGLEAQGGTVEDLNGQDHRLTGSDQSLVIKQIEAGFWVI